MFLKGKTKLTFAGGLIFIIFYFFIAAEPLKKDLYLLPLWSTSVLQETNSDELLNNNEEKNFENILSGSISKNEKIYPFIVSENFGYFTQEGNIFHLKKTKKRISASYYAWAEYTEDSSEKKIYSSKGKLITTINADGFIHIDKDRFFLFEPGGYSVSEYGSDGLRKWRYAHTAAITAFNSSPKACVIGYSDGKLVCVANDGKEIFGFYPGGSTYQVIMGAAVSNDGSQIICVSGVDKQRALLIKISSGQYKIVKHLYLDKNLHKQIFTGFNEAGNFAVFESGNGIGIINCQKLTISFLEEYDSIVDICSDTESKIITILTQNNNNCKLLFIDPNLIKISKTEFLSKNTFLLQEKNKIFVGSDSKIFAVEIKGKR